jgi:hypothetical protein
VITSGMVQFRPGRLEGGGMVFLRFRAWLQELDETAGGIGAVFFEEVRRHIGTAAAHAYGGCLAHLTAWAEALQLPYYGVPVGTIKRHVTGKGNAGEHEVIAAVRAKGFAPGDDNEADALALLDWAARTCCSTPPPSCATGAAATATLKICSRAWRCAGRRCWGSR